jgi:hypothetical protein
MQEIHLFCCDDGLDMLSMRKYENISFISSQHFFMNDKVLNAKGK